MNIPTPSREIPACSSFSPTYSSFSPATSPFLPSCSSCSPERNLSSRFFISNQVLGSGSGCKVYLGTDKLKDEPIAVKVTSVNSPSRRSNTYNEITALERLEGHAHIVKLLDYEQDRTCIKLYLQYGGQNLLDYVKKNTKLEESEVQQIFPQMISAIDFCHRKNICHRDVKLENFLIDGHKNILLTDFSLSTIIKPGKLFTKPCGSPCYVAPEIAKHKPYDHTVDIWSLGVVLYAMLCGYFPFSDCLEPRSSFPSHLSEEAKSLITLLLVKKRKKRCSLEELTTHPFLRS